VAAGAGRVEVDAATEPVREVAGKVPRWAVLAKGVELRRYELQGRAGF
jgi:hypothetical protein